MIYRNETKSEIYRIWKGKRFLLGAIYFFLVSCFDLYLGWKNSAFNIYGENFDYKELIHPTYAAFLSGSTEGHVGQMIIIWILPLYIMIIIGDSYIQEKRVGFIYFKLQRAQKRRILLTDIKLTFAATCIMFAIVLLLNLLLSYLIFHGGKDFYDLQDYVQYMGKFNAYQFGHPYLTYFLYILFFSGIAGVLAVTCKCITWIVPKYGISYMISFFMWIVLSFGPYSFIDSIQPFAGETVYKNFIVSVCLFVFVNLTIIVFAYRKRMVQDDI